MQDSTDGNQNNQYGAGTRAEDFATRLEQRADRFGKRMEDRFDRDHNGGNVVWALFLIFIGGVFLLNSTGLVDWSVWTYLWRFWPLFIVLAGVQILVGRSKAASVLVSIFAILVLLGVGFMSLVAVKSPIIDGFNTQLPSWFEDIMTGNQVGNELTQDATVEAGAFDNVEARDVVIDVGLSNFTFVDSDTPDILFYDATFYQNFGGPQLDQAFSNNKLTLNFRQVDQQNVTNVSKLPEYNFTLGAVDLPTDFDFTIGAGSGDVELSKVKVNDMSVDVGVGSMKLTLSEDSIPADFKVKIGAGHVTVTLPESVGYKLNYDVGVGTIVADGEKIASLGDDDVYKSKNYDKSATKVTIDVEVGVGELKIITN